MSTFQSRRQQKLTIIAKDPSVRVGGRILTAVVEIPAEELSPGPRGYRVQVVDYDASSGLLYPPLEHRVKEDGSYNDPFESEPDDVLLGDPAFHAQNVYAIVMRVLARFEQALGRRVSWSFGGHQLQVAPHAFLEANAFYSQEDRSLLFGYFPYKRNGAEVDGCDGTKACFPSMVFSCLSHDVVAHETTHALLDGLRPRYTDPSSPEQAAFHEGFSDIVALLSIYSLQDVVQKIIDQAAHPDSARDGSQPRIVSSKTLTPKALRQSLLFSMGREFGQGLGRGTSLRRSINLRPSKEYIKKKRFEEPHRRGELLVAAMMNAFLQIWLKRIDSLSPHREKAADQDGSDLDFDRVVEDGAAIADQLLTMAIRAIDYCPPTDLQFCDFLSALLTADRELRPDDRKLRFRETLRNSFESYGITPTSKGDGSEPGVWEPPDCTLKYERVHMEPMLRDRDEMFRFLWENRVVLGLDKDAYTRVQAVQPALRVNPDDGFVLRETVAHYQQILNVEARELKHLGIRKPDEPVKMPDCQQVTLYGGGTLIFDEFGRLKFHVRNRLLNPERQTQRLKYLWRFGHFDRPQILEKKARRDNTFARMHLRRLEACHAGDDHDRFF